MTKKETIVFNHEGTGGNCTAYIYRWEDDKNTNEILLTDGDLSAPKNIDTDSVSVSWFSNGEFMDGIDTKNRHALLLAISNILGREIDKISIVKSL